MQTISALLDKAKKRRSLASDTALATVFGLHRQAISKWRNGEAYPSQDHIAQLADLAGEDPAAWLVRVQAEREQGAAGEAWRRLARQLGAAAALALAAALPYHGSEAGVNPAKLNADNLYIMRSLHRWLRSLVSPLYA